MISVSIAEEFVTKQGEDGPYEVSIFFLTATTPKDQVFAHQQTYQAHEKEKAERRLRYLERHVQENLEWTPETSKNWRFWRNIYGGKSWSQSDEGYLQRLDVEAEDGAGSYQPNHPGFIGY